MENLESRQVRDAVITIDNFIKNHLYELHPKTVDRWFDVKTEIDKIVQKDTGKSVYGCWDQK